MRQSRHNRLPAWAGAAMLAAVAGLLLTAPVAAGTPYVVRSCEAVSATNPVNNAWALQVTGNAGAWNCTQGSTSIILSSFGNGYGSLRGEGARAWFIAPWGTTITGLNWRGSLFRNAYGDCNWDVGVWAHGPGWDQRIWSWGAGTFCAGSSPREFAPTEVLGYAINNATSLSQQVFCLGPSTCSGGLSSTYLTMRYADVVLEDHYDPGVYPTGGPILNGKWVRGRQAVTAWTEDNIGIREVQVFVDGVLTDSKAFSCDYTRPAPCANQGVTVNAETGDRPDGATHEVRLRAIDASGRSKDHVQEGVRLDNNAPAQVMPDVGGGDGWRKDNGFGLSWQNPGGQHAPIVAAHYRLCKQAEECVTGSRSGGGISQIGDIRVPGPGDWSAKVWLEDEAGNGNASEPARASETRRLRFDPDPPKLAFASQDPSDPLRVEARATDPVSGVADGVIEIRRSGGKTWHELNTSAQQGKLVADVDDEGLPDGSYELRAFAVDRAGNRGSTEELANGSRAGLRLPVRIVSRLRAGVPKVVRKRGKRGGRRVVRLIPVKRIGFRRSVKISGRLANPDGQPLDDARVLVFSRPHQLGGEFGLVGEVRTDRRGRFTYRAKAAMSRTLRFRYPGTRTRRGATRDVKILVPAHSTMNVSRRRVLNGEDFSIFGRVSGPIPQGGKLVEVQAYYRRAWRTFQSLRTDPQGRWRTSYRFGTVTGRATYPLRAKLPRETLFPYETGHSHAIRMQVRGL